MFGFISKSWRSNLLFLSLLFVLIGFTAAESANVVEVDSTSTSIESDKATGAEAVVGKIKDLIKVAINGPDPNILIERDAKDGIERLTDDNYVEMVEHPFGGGKEDEFWVVLVHGKLSDLHTETIMDYHKNATDLAKADSELNNVRWARLDYITSWRTCTRWMLFKPPIIVIISDQGKTLRFIKTISLGKEPENLYNVMKKDIYKVVTPWEGRWSPSGNRSFLLEYYIFVQEKISRVTNRIPSWAMLPLSGLFAQQLMAWLHGTPTPPNAVTREQTVTITEEKKED
ncbi:uncharacterized protein IL334_000431 [Kwoniella shivajii]|uniref:Thioredoxin-like fold domain-containing protein n=1 Tax=Kwoniella shivajii TaxID=564305 RepID=A0ABZ1CPF7_9TREE|nr:hypothetical protein IL334_000431 [Kwoniella shivajii]